MDIILAYKTNIKEVMSLIKAVRIDLEAQGIYQWNSYYPKKKHLNESILNDSLYLLKDNKIYLGLFQLMKTLQLHTTI